MIREVNWHIKEKIGDEVRAQILYPLRRVEESLGWWNELLFIIEEALSQAMREIRRSIRREWKRISE